MASHIGKEKYFGSLTPPQIRNGASKVIAVGGSVDDIVDAFLEAPSDHALEIASVIDGVPIIPKEHYHDGKRALPLNGPAKVASWRFSRHGPEVTLRRYGSTRDIKAAVEALRRKDLPKHLDLGLVPSAYFFVEETNRAALRVFNDRKNREKLFSGYSFVPVVGNRDVRKVRLVDLLEAARLFAYANQEGASPIVIEGKYLKSRAVWTDGGKARFKVPSRRANARPYKFMQSHLPVAYNWFRHLIAYWVSSNLNNHEEKNNLNTQFRAVSGDQRATRRADMMFFVPQEIAAYWALAKYFSTAPDSDLDRIYKGRKFRKQYARMVVTECSPFRMPNQEMVDHYLRMLNRVFVPYIDKGGKRQERHLAKAEREILLWEIVRRKEHPIWDTFYVPRGQKLQELNWTKNKNKDYTIAA